MYLVCHSAWAQMTSNACHLCCCLSYIGLLRHGHQHCPPECCHYTSDQFQNMFSSCQGSIVAWLEVVFDPRSALNLIAPPYIYIYVCTYYAYLCVCSLWIGTFCLSAPFPVGHVLLDQPGRDLVVRAQRLDSQQQHRA